MGIFSNACPSSRGFTVGRAASHSRAGSSRATSNSNFVIDEGSIIADEMIRGINKPVAVLQTRSSNRNCVLNSGHRQG
jgi:hypothetical protein